MKLVSFSFVVAATLFAGCPDEQQESSKKAEKPVTQGASADEEKAAPAPAGQGSVKGVISFEGAVPAPEKLDMSSTKDCKGAKTRQTVVVKDGKLANAVAYIKTGLKKKKWDVPKEAVVLNQQDCRYQPSVLAVQTKQDFLIKNSDSFMHNVHSKAKGAEFNIAMPKKNTDGIKKVFKKRDVFADIVCDAHSWMKASVAVVDHPFFTLTGDDGQFVLEDVPAGTYTLEFAHPALPPVSREVNVEDGKAAEISVTLTAGS